MEFFEKILYVGGLIKESSFNLDVPAVLISLD
jgi:hypothetical protein